MVKYFMEWIGLVRKRPILLAHDWFLEEIKSAKDIPSTAKSIVSFPSL